MPPTKSFLNNTFQFPKDLEHWSALINLLALNLLDSVTFDVTDVNGVVYDGGINVAKTLLVKNV